MQIANQNPNTYAPNFQAMKNFRLPTKEVLECTTGIFSSETRENPKNMLKIFSKLYDIKPQTLSDINRIPLSFHIYALSSGTMIKANNPDILKLSNKISKMPKESQIDEINKATDKIGNLINIVIDDSIKAYKNVDGQIITTK